MPRKEKVGEYDAEVYEMNAGGQTVKMWAAKDYPNAQALKDTVVELKRRATGEREEISTESALARLTA